MIVIYLVLAFIEGDQSGNQQAQMSICLFLFCRFYMVELKLSYRSSHLKHYKEKPFRKIYKKESKFIWHYPVDNVLQNKAQS